MAHELDKKEFHLTYELDEKDNRILEILQEHAEYTTRQIAKKTMLPITTVHHRIKKLREEKVIQQYTIKIDPAAVGKNFVAYVLISADLSLLKQKKKTQYDLAGELRKFPFVERVDIVSGRTDLVVIIAVKDVSEFDKVLLGKLQSVEGVKNTQSMIVLHQS